MDGERDPDAVHSIVSRKFSKRFNMIWSRSIGFNNTYALTVRSSAPHFEKINNIGQLKDKIEQLKIASPHEFMERKDGLIGFTEKYSLEFNSDKIISLSAGLMYSAIRDNQVDLIVSYSTDGRIKAYDLKILHDDKNYFPPYQAAFLSKKESLEKHPNLAKAIILLEGLISESEMTELNDKVDRLKQEIKDVARNFLIQKKIIKGIQVQKHVETNFLKYFISKKTYVKKLPIEHLLLSFVALFFATIVAIPS